MPNFLVVDENAGRMFDHGSIAIYHGRLADVFQINTSHGPGFGRTLLAELPRADSGSGFATLHL